MARLILKSPYIKCSGNANAGGYLKYIATRERVEIIPDDRPPTRKQEQLITKLVKDFPDTKELLEYEDYTSHPTKVNASALISLTLEENWSKVQTMDGYAKYIATRPRAERLGGHGLFGESDEIGLDAAMNELENYTGNVWTHIISLKREDAARLGFDNAAAWRDLLRAHRNDIATAMKIPPNDFRWYAAFHDEGDHPHIHMMAWSAKAGQAYLSKDGIRQIKSTLTNHIFQNEMLHLYEQKSVSRDELVYEVRKAMLEMVRTMKEGICDHPEAEQLMLELALQLETVQGKKSYGYLPKPQKKLVDRIVDEMERLPSVGKCYEQWQILQGKVDSYYHDKEQKRIPLSQQKEFRQIKNAVIKEAEHIRQGKMSFEDADLSGHDEPFDDYGMSYNCWELQNTANDLTQPLDERDEVIQQLERLAEAGDIHAQYLIGTAYRDGGLLIPDTEKAEHFLNCSANQNYAPAQYALGKLYLSDDPDIHDSKAGIYWLRQAAENGNDYAAYRLGKKFLEEEHITKNAETAAFYLEQAANDGNAYAQYLLGKLYLMGEGVPKDADTAYEWFTEAQENDHAYTGFFLDRTDRPEPPSVLLSATRLLHHISRIFRDQAPSVPAVSGIQIDRKRWAELQEMRIALGHAPDDHEDELNYKYTQPSM